MRRQPGEEPRPVGVARGAPPLDYSPLRGYLPTAVAYVALLGPNECFDARSQVVASVRGRSVIFYS